MDRKIVNMSVFLTDMLDEENEASDMITLDFADEESFANLLEFCEKSGYSEKQEFERRLIAKPDVRQLAEIFVENANEADKVDERWKVEFFNKLTLEQNIKLANLANYMNVPQLIDSCLEVIAI